MVAYGVAGFDSAAVLLQAAAAGAAGEEFPAIGHPTFLQYLVRASEWLPEQTRRAAYAAATGFESVPHSRIDKVDPAEIAEWATSLYEAPKYPAIMIGSSSGALVHLAAAMRIPWLPQTVMVALLRQGGGIDDPRGDLEQAKACGEKLVAANPDIQLHQMHDPSQDRLSLQYISYFRFKYRRLPAAYRRFIEERLQPGGLIIVSDCTKRWPTTRVNDRYFFQFGAVGGMEPEEYVSGSERVRDYLAYYETGLERWDPPEADSESPEAEWGFEPSIMGDIEELGRRGGHRSLRLAFEDAEYLSAPVADLHRDWYKQLGVTNPRLLVESFALIEPHWTLRTRSVPFWMTFNSGPSLDYLGEYLEQSPRYGQIRTMIFPHGTRSVGLPSVEDWRRVMRRGSDDVDFLGVSEDKYPNHFASLADYYNEARKLDEVHDLPEPMAVDIFEQFMRALPDRYRVEVSGGSFS
jgi:hypothetical protein